ncbi:hypothetical protein SDC9_116090 [bioreactor metagenome]|uniref:Uncharacterized protein n=1 Tax=bioreactor metagenome TaxID=1076179 RepID=A0A645BUN6_9ZZZZ
MVAMAIGMMARTAAHEILGSEKAGTAIGPHDQREASSASFEIVRKRLMSEAK